MSLNRQNYYKSLINSSRNKRKIKSLSYSKASPQKILLHDFITTEETYDDFELLLIPFNTILYQGTDFDFEGGKKTINDYYDYYNKRHNGAYFLSSYEVASRYGTDRTNSKLIYINLPNKEGITRRIPLDDYEYLYPMYYIEGLKGGATIKYTLNKGLKLINIGNIQNVEKLWHIIKGLNINKKDKKKYIDTLYETCAFDDDNKSDSFNSPPTDTLRHSTTEDDNELIELFINVFKPYFKENYKIDIDGWIYYQHRSFHDEILLIDNTSLVFKDMQKSVKNAYKGIPSYDEFKKKIDKIKVKYNPSINDKNIISNYERQ